jgi:hypothetical protein
MSRKVLLKFLLASLKIPTNSGYFIESRNRIPPPPHPPTRLAATQGKLPLGASIQPLKLPTINHPPLMKKNTGPRFKIPKTGRIFTVSVFVEASQNFIFSFLHRKATKKFKNNRRIYRKY